MTGILKKQLFEVRAKIVTEEFNEENSKIAYEPGRDLECFNEYKVDKNKPGILERPLANLDKKFPTGQVFQPFKEQ